MVQETLTATASAPFSIPRGSPDELLTTREAAAWLRVTVHTVQLWIKSGRLRGVKTGKEYRIRRRDLEAWYEEQRG